MDLIPASRVSTKRVLVICSVVIVLALISVVILLWPSTPSGGLSRTQAIQTAWTHVNTGAVAVSSASVHHNFNTGFDLPVHSWAWVVTFDGHWQLLCDGPCDRTTEWVAIDYYTGAWIASEYSYPARQ